MKPSGAPPIRLAIVDDSELVRVGLQTLLEGAAGIHLCATASTAAEALIVCRRERPDLVLLDIRLPDGTGKVLVEGKRRARIAKYVDDGEFFLVDAEPIEEALNNADSRTNLEARINFG